MAVILWGITSIVLADASGTSVLSRPKMQVLKALRLLTITVIIIVLPCYGAAQANNATPALRVADIGHGITLHYMEEGTGVPMVFVHGSLSDGGYWADQIGPFSMHYRAIAYSRRYNYPNNNPSRSGYSALVDAEDLAAFIHSLHLGKVVVIDHSYGALAALFLAAKHPELIRALVLAEPPAISLLLHLPNNQAKAGNTEFNDIQQHMVLPMQRAFRKCDREAGIAAFMAYVFKDPHAWDKIPQSAKRETLRNAGEWDVMMTTGTLFPDIEPRTIQEITVPTLLLSGTKSYPFLGLTTEELARLFPHSQTRILPEAGHQMWLQYPEVCRKAVEEFLGEALQTQRHAVGNVPRHLDRSSPLAVQTLRSRAPSQPQRQHGNQQRLRIADPDSPKQAAHRAQRLDADRKTEHDTRRRRDHARPPHPQHRFLDCRFIGMRPIQYFRVRGRLFSAVHICPDCGHLVTDHDLQVCRH